MSLYDFIATDDGRFPRLLSSKKHTADGRAKNRFDSYDDLYELEILKDENPYKDVFFYTGLPFIYSIDWSYSQERCRTLSEHLMRNLSKGSRYEIHRILLADSRSAKSFRRDIDNGLKERRDHKLSVSVGPDRFSDELCRLFGEGEIFFVRLY